MTIFEEINKIKIEDILTATWIRFSQHWDVLNLFDNWKPTDWWKADLVRWIVSNFSVHKTYRATWDRITFVMWQLWIDKWAAVIWFKETFKLSDDKKDNIPDLPFEDKKPTTKELIDIWIDTRKRILTKWNWLSKLNDDQINYLVSRWIDYLKVDKYIKNNLWYVCCSLYDEKWIITIQNRSITEKKFMIEKWTNSKWCFISDINKEIKKVYVVEWMFDFLTLAQFWVNTIWLKSVHDWLDMVRAFYKKWYEIILIPDNDDAWQTVIDNLKDIKFSLFDLKWYEVKDINELLISSELWEWIIEAIELDRTKEPKNIDMAFKKFDEIKTIFKQRWKLWQPWPFEILDKETQWIIEWKVYTIWWFSNTGKSQFSYEYARYFLKQWKKVVYISIEVDTWLLLWYIAKAYYKKQFDSILNWSSKIDRDDFSNLFLYDNISTLDWIIKTVELEKPDIVFIDFIQWINCSWQWEYEKMTMLAWEIQKMAIRNQCVVFNLSQVNNDSRDKEWSKVMLKWSWALFQSSDVIFILYEEMFDLKLAIAKNKFWKKWQVFILNIDFNTWVIKVNKELCKWF